MQSAGAYLGSNLLHTVRNRTAGLLALLAIFLHVVVPTAYDLSASSTQGLIKTVICSGGMAKEVYLDENGKPVPTNNADHEGCKTSCLHHCAALFVSTIGFIKPSWAILLGTLVASSSADAQFAGASHPRGPPA